MKYKTISQVCFKCGYGTQFKISLEGELEQFKGFTRELLTEEICPKCRARKQIFHAEKMLSINDFRKEKEEKENG